MPRQDVPYPSRAICSLKERIAELEDKIELLMKSINGVAGDGQGNVTLKADHAAIVITNDAPQHEVGIGLDTSELPAADVSSVNGQTGAVVLDAGDIGTSGGSDVQADLTALGTGVAAASAAVTAEASARASADATLQTNINTVSAGLPAAAAAAVAADPTIAQLQSDVLAIPNKVDKRTGTGVRAYTHDGATQGDTVVLDGTTAATIPIRDASGRLQAADPASGATDKTLVTANWMSQTGDSAPNNVVHRSGDETVNGTKTQTTACDIATILSADAQTYTWYRVAKLSASSLIRVSYIGALPYNNTRLALVDAVIVTATTANPTQIFVERVASKFRILTDQPYIAVAFDGSDYWLFMRCGQYVHNNLYAMYASAAGKGINSNARLTKITPVVDDPTTYTYYSEA